MNFITNLIMHMICFMKQKSLNILALFFAASITTSDSDIEGTKQKVERMRKSHGSDWLLALQDPYCTPSINSGPSRDASSSRVERPTMDVDVEHHIINTERRVS